MEFPLLEVCLPTHSFVDIVIIMPTCTAVFHTFQSLSCDFLSNIIHKLNKTTCVLNPFPTKLFMSHLSSIINITLDVVNKESFIAVLASQESKVQKVTANLQSESGKKNCVRISRQMVREGRDAISVCCMKNDIGNFVSDADGMKNI